ncbi:MAG: PD40 domain-containing protein [Bacteroidales bacterium]|nr:PD40 domain-containing protein [Bacteroidales bacterium]
MKKITKYLIIVVAVLAVLILARRLSSPGIPVDCVKNGRIPEIFPDYTDITVPVNIAPLNFKIINKAKKFRVSFSGSKCKAFVIKTKENKVIIPERKWRKFIKSNSNDSISIQIYAKNNNSGWEQYKTIRLFIASDKMDSYIVFRHINTGYILWEKMGIFQHNIENYKKTPILLNERTDRNCMNCHTFCNQNPGQMLIHLRTPPSGTILYKDNEVKFINTGTPYTMSAGVYPSWHPDGNLIAFSVNLINQQFHAASQRNIYVFDRASDIVVYDIDLNEVTTCPELSTKSLENLPAWSPDGKFLYYISGVPYDKKMPDSLVKYDLLRIPFDAQYKKWGKPDTILTAKETGQSISFPEISPDGRFLIFCMAQYGYFNIHSPGSDLYIMDLENMNYSKLPVNSNYTESFHSWSSNSRWLLFVSKRLDGLYSRVFFSHIDTAGNASKPFLLPQKDPDYYETLLLNYNRPVFVKNKIKISANKLSKKAFSGTVNATFDKNVNIDALSGATRISSDAMYQLAD